MFVWLTCLKNHSGRKNALFRSGEDRRVGVVSGFLGLLLLFAGACRSVFLVLWRWRSSVETWGPENRVAKWIICGGGFLDVADDLVDFQDGEIDPGIFVRSCSRTTVSAMRFPRHT